MEFSVLMSVYIEDNPIYFDQALNSVLINQTYPPTEVVLVKDGKLTTDLEDVIYRYKYKFPNKLKIIGLEQNCGLGKALDIGLDYCTYDLVGRMDSDDISDKYRFQKQIDFFKKNKNISVVGGVIGEFYNTTSSLVAKRVVPNNTIDITSMMKRRNPMNHVSVMFKKSDVKNAGGYVHLPYLEDYYLWIRMVEAGYNLANIEDILVYVRTGDEMYKRRGNKKYIRGWYILQKKMKDMELINIFNIILNMSSIAIFVYMPVRIKEFVYKHLLRQTI